MARMLNRSALPEHLLSSAHPWLPEGDDGDTGGGGAGGDQGADQSAADAQGKPDADGDNDAWKARARTWETRANADKARADKAEAELAKVRKASQTEAEKAVEAAREEGRRAALAEVADQRVRDRLETVLSGARRGLTADQRAALLDGVNTGRFIGDDGSLDGDSIKKWADKVAPEQARDFGQGRERGGTAKTTDMSSLIREQVAKRR